MGDRARRRIAALAFRAARGVLVPEHVEAFGRTLDVPAAEYRLERPQEAAPGLAGQGGIGVILGQTQSLSGGSRRDAADRGRAGARRGE